MLIACGKNTQLSMLKNQKGIAGLKNSAYLCITIKTNYYEMYI